MSVRDVFNPNPVNPTDPNVSNKQSEGGAIQKALKLKEQIMADSILDTSAARARAETAKAEAEATKAEAEARKAQEEPLPVPEPPFQFKGSINMGDIDMQRDAREAKEATEAENARRDKELKEEREKREVVEKEKHQLELAGIQKDMNQKMESLEKTILAGNANQKSITTQIGEIQELAGILGFQKPDPALAGSMDVSMRIDLIKLQNDNARAEREFKREMRREEREYQRLMRKDDDDRHFRQGEADRQAKRDEMFAKAPEMVGRAIASGMMEGGGANAKQKPQSYHLEAAAGAGGEAECPYCSSEIAIGPTARSAVCPNPECGAKLPIKRIELEESGENDRRNS